MNNKQEATIFVNQELMKEDDQKKIKELYTKLGEAYYKGAYEDPLPQLLPLFNSITEVFKEYEKKPKICSNCGSELEEDAQFCVECGYPVGEIDRKSKEHICKHCGNVLRPASKFCGVCGKPVE